MRANIETAGNLLNGAAKAFGLKKNGEGQYTLFNIAYAQYAKFDFDYTHLMQFDKRNALALHAGFGIAYPYGNSRVLPFEKPTATCSMAANSSASNCVEPTRPSRDWRATPTRTTSSIRQKPS